MGELVNMCENSFRFLKALFRIFGNQLVLHNKSEQRYMYGSDAKRYSDNSHRDSRLDVLIEAEQVRGIILVLQGHQPRIGRFAVSGLDPVDSLIGLIVDIDLA